MVSEPVLTRRLIANSDSFYADFTVKLLPCIDRKCIIGVRIPALRAIAKSAAGTPEAEEFLESLPHRYYDENNLHAALLSLERHDIDSLLARVEMFLPYIDNWATCDLLKPKLFAMNPGRVYEKAAKWLHAPHTFTARFAVTTLIYFYLGENYRPGQSDMCAALRSGEYYVNMALAWYFAEGLARRTDDFLPYFEPGRIANPWVAGKALQKARESLRIPREFIERLTELKRSGLQ